MRRGQHEVGGDRNTAAEALGSDDQDHVSGDGLIGGRCAADQRSGG